MTSYLKPLRRKIGVVTIGLTLVFAAGWLRSLFVTDLVLFPTSNSLHSWISDQRGVAWTVETQTDQEHRDLMYGIHVPFVISPTFFQSHPKEWRLKVSICGLSYFTGTPKEQTESSHFIPYWSIVVPLALLSAWLLLSMPRPKKFPVSKTEKL